MFRILQILKVMGTEDILLPTLNRACHALIIFTITQIYV